MHAKNNNRILADIHLHQAVRVLRQGGVIAYPTEAVFGIGCDARNEKAIKRILELKRRAVKKGLIVIAADVSQLHDLVAPLSPSIRDEVMSTWPGPVTWILPARDSVSPLLRGQHHGIAVRVTAHPLAASLCKRFGGAIVSTSANRSGKPSARTTEETRYRLGSDLDYILPGDVGGLAKPTQIRDALTGRILRPN